jgi:hypothetical protein
MTINQKFLISNLAIATTFFIALTYLVLTINDGSFHMDIPYHDQDLIAVFMTLFIIPLSVGLLHLLLGYTIVYPIIFIKIPHIKHWDTKQKHNQYIKNIDKPLNQTALCVFRC